MNPLVYSPLNGSNPLVQTLPNGPYPLVHTGFGPGLYRGNVLREVYTMGGFLPCADWFRHPAEIDVE